MSTATVVGPAPTVAMHAFIRAGQDIRFAASALTVPAQPMACSVLPMTSPVRAATTALPSMTTALPSKTTAA